MNNLIWCPIDVPKLPRSFQEHGGNIWHFWKKTNFTEKKQTPYDESEWTQHVLAKYPEFVEWFKCLPYATIRNVKFNIQVHPVSPHIDFTQPLLKPDLHNNNALNEPCGYRIIVTGKRTNALYVMDGDKKVYCNMPQETDVYVLGHTNTLHGVDDEPGRETIFVHIEVNPDQHQLLLSRSLAKYKQYAIYETE